MVTKLQLFNAALDELGEANVSDTGEAIESARVLVSQYDKLVAECLAAGSWNFAMETLTSVSSGSTPALGYAHTFSKPTDWVATEALTTDSGYAVPLLDYYEDKDYWAADTGQIYTRYVSDDTGKGLDLPAWPAKFTRWVELELASRACMRITENAELLNILVNRAATAKQDAFTHDIFRPPWPDYSSTTNSKARIIHKALLELGNIGKIAVHGEDARRILTRLFDNVVAECLAAGSWNFAMETLTSVSSGSTPALGYAHTFSKPTDWVATEALATDSGYVVPLLDYYEDKDYWAADTGQIYTRYVSDDTGKGLDYPAWPAKFTRWVELELAMHAWPSFHQSARPPHETLQSLVQPGLSPQGPSPQNAPSQGAASHPPPDINLLEFLVRRSEAAKQDAFAHDLFRPPWPNFSSTTTSKARIIHKALLELGDIGKITVQGEDARRILTRLYDDVVAECLAAGSWNFAMETIKATADTGVEPEFGYTEVFAKPADWVNTVAVSEDENFAFPLTQYVDDANFWSANGSPIYVRYVSDDTGLGLELTRWTADFRRYVELELAFQACEAVVHSFLGADARLSGKPISYGQAAQLARMTVERVKADRNKAKRKALASDALNEPQPKFPPPSSWTTARGGRTGLRDRGSRGSLTD